MDALTKVTDIQTTATPLAMAVISNTAAMSIEVVVAAVSTTALTGQQMIAYPKSTAAETRGDQVAIGRIMPATQDLDKLASERCSLLQGANHPGHHGYFALSAAKQCRQAPERRSCREDAKITAGLDQSALDRS